MVLTGRFAAILGRRSLRSKHSWRPIIGLEIHAQLASRKKLFSAALNEADAQVNLHVAPFDAALPGTLPMLNWGCVELATRAALLFNCQIQTELQFDRKHYHYIDLPLGYQITQHFRPFAIGGRLRLEDGNEIRIKQIQIEQDSAKTMQEEESKADIKIDLNRAGVGLIELVTEPDFTSAEGAVAFCKKIHMMLCDAGVCGGCLEAGQMRFDANVSIASDEGERAGLPLGVRVEIKNLNSFVSLRVAIEREIERQMKILRNHGKIKRETRSFDMKSKMTISSRDKEELADYRFIRDYDLPVLPLTRDFIERVARNMPETRINRYARLATSFGLSPMQVDSLLLHKGLLELFEGVAVKCATPMIAYNFLINNYLGMIAKRGFDTETSPISLSTLLFLIQGLDSGTIDNFTAKRILSAKLDGDPRDHSEIALNFPSPSAPLNLPQDMALMLCTLAKDRPKKAALVKENDSSAVDHFVGPLMKINNNRIAPKDLRPLVERFLKEQT